MVKCIITVRIDSSAINTRALGQVTVLLHRDRADHGQNQMVVADPDIVVTCAALAAVRSTKFNTCYLAATQARQQGNDPLADLTDCKAVYLILGRDRVVLDECLQFFETGPLAVRLIYKACQGIVGTVFLIEARGKQALLHSRGKNGVFVVKEVNIFLRGMFPLVGFKSTSVYYERRERIAGESHYPLKKMLALAFDGITSLSIKPIRLITGLGAVISGLGFLAIIWAIVMQVLGHTVAGWASLVCIVAFLGGIQLLSLGVIGEYIGKIYLETKARPRYIISERTSDEKRNRKES